MSTFWFIFVNMEFYVDPFYEKNTLFSTAGSAKNEMAKTEKHEATIFPIQVLGTVSPYPIVVTVITPHQSASA